MAEGKGKFYPRLAQWGQRYLDLRVRNKSSLLLSTGSNCSEADEGKNCMIRGPSPGHRVPSACGWLSVIGGLATLFYIHGNNWGLPRNPTHAFQHSPGGTGLSVPILQMVKTKAGRQSHGKYKAEPNHKKPRVKAARALPGALGMILQGQWLRLWLYNSEINDNTVRQSPHLPPTNTWRPTM